MVSIPKSIYVSSRTVCMSWHNTLIPQDTTIGRSAVERTEICFVDEKFHQYNGVLLRSTRCVEIHCTIVSLKKKTNDSLSLSFSFSFCRDTLCRQFFNIFFFFYQKKMNLYKRKCWHIFNNKAKQNKNKKKQNDPVVPH